MTRGRLLLGCPSTARTTGDFVECGVNTGIFSLAVCEYVDFNRLDKSLWLFDTYKGFQSSKFPSGSLPQGNIGRSGWA
jgi:O-methyltransferase